MADKVDKSDADWRRELTPEQYHVLREKGTERAFTGDYHDEQRPGVYRCGGCGTPLFRSTEKYFFEPLAKERIREERDTSLGMVRTEVTCDACGGHLGHVFPDGPPPTGLRYCINSLALQLDDEADPEAPPAT